MTSFGHDLGLVTMGTPDAWATFSPCEVYRYALARIWDDHRPMLVAVLHNPSKARHDLSDPTLAKVCKYGKRDGFGGVLMGNVFAFKATDPRDLLAAYRAGVDVVGQHNIEVVRRLVDGPMLAKAVAGWGPPKSKHLRSAYCRMRVLGSREWHCWHVTKDGHPGHPLYLRDDAPLRLLREAGGV